VVRFSSELQLLPSFVEKLKRERGGKKRTDNDEIKVEEMGGSCSKHEEARKACKISVGKPEGKRPVGRPRRGWENNIKMDLRVQCEDLDWIQVDHDMVQ
jgi:hypothetical protein